MCRGSMVLLSRYFCKPQLHIVAASVVIIVSVVIVVSVGIVVLLISFVVFFMLPFALLIVVNLTVL
jgi:hypothetical protein